ncbi:unnamed protein product [Mytilus edulis]|uniref:C1q domain-containing protein n=1 Tax=Mytilus edulis TaxID=6550 RepID=A0A8S3UTD5_MYTED|nr:unnamed protein product [Mytilus edulis]
MQLKEKEAVYSTEIAELKAEIAILLEEKDTGIRSEIKKWRSKEHIAFSASIPAASNNLSDHQTVVYSRIIPNQLQEITDTSSSYNPSDGIFTAPVSGVYVFTWSASCGEGRWQDTELVVDSAPYRFLSVDSNENKYFGSAAQTVVLEVCKVTFI